MIKSLVRGKEISVGVINEVGALARVTSFLVNHGINLIAIAGYSNNIGDQAALIFVTDNNFAAVNELASNGYEQIAENDVIIIDMENRPGALKNISELMAQNGININYFYCTTCSGGCPAKIILSTSDNDKAAEILNS
ncbi:MAG: ACT domain-containing protein [Candidatus Omnitrophota bacterium]